jgi:hypothetical protein
MVPRKDGRTSIIRPVAGPKRDFDVSITSQVSYDEAKSAVSVFSEIFIKMSCIIIFGATHAVPPGHFFQAYSSRLYSVDINSVVK